MAKRDVELIIRAKNEASRALDAAAKSMQSLEDQQASLGVSAKKTDNLIGGLTEEFAKLKAVASNIKAFDKIKEQAEKAGAAFEAQSNDLSKARTELKALADSQALVGAESVKLAQDVGKSSQALKAQSAALTTSKTELDGYSTASRKAAASALAAEKALATAQTRYRDKPTPKNEAKLVDASLAVNAARKAAREAAVAQDVLTRAYREQAAAVTVARQSHSLVATSLKDVQSAEKSLAAEIGRTGLAVARQTEYLAAAENEYEALSQVVSRAEETFNRAASAQSVVGKSAQAVGVQLAQLKGKIQELQAAQRVVTPTANLIDPAAIREANLGLRDATLTIRAATNEASKGSVGLRELGLAVEQVAKSGQQLDKLLSSVKKQESAVAQAKDEWASAQAEVKRLAGALRSATEPSDALAESFGRAQGKARAAKSAFAAQEEAASELGTALRQAGVQHGTLAEAQRTLEGSVAKNSNVLLRGRAALIGYSGGAEQASKGSRNAAKGISTVGPAAGKSATGIKSMARELLGLEESGRRALSFGQRFRGQLLAIGAATGGIYAVQAGLQAVVKTQLELDAVSARFGVAFQGDQGKVSQALAFTRKTADDLGLSYKTLALQYSKLSAASLGTNLEGKKTEDIFLGISQAARVLRLTDEEVEGSFKALTDIMSKGTIQAEELKGQLGDRFPGAVQIMAEAVGVSTAELLKMMEQGQLTSDALVGFADTIAKRVAPSLESSIDSPAAAFARLGNSITDIQVAVASSGFLEELAKGTVELSEALKDPAVQEGFKQLGAGLGDLIRFGATVLPHMGALLTGLEAIAVFLTVRFVGGALKDTFRGLSGLRDGFRLVRPAVAEALVALRAAEGGFLALSSAMQLAAVLKLGALGIIAVELGAIALAAYEAYQAVSQLNEERERAAKRTSAAEGELAAKQKAYNDLRAKEAGALVKAQDDATDAVGRTKRGVEQLLESYKSNAQDGYIRSTGDVIKMSNDAIDVYQDLLIARMKVVGAARTEALLNPDDEKSAAIITQTTIEMNALARAVELSAVEERARADALKGTASALGAIAAAEVSATLKADLLATRLSAVATMNFDQAVLALSKVHDAKVSALTLTGADEGKILAADSQYETQLLALTREASAKKLALVEQDTQRRIAILDSEKPDAQKRADELYKIEQTASTARIAIAQQEVSAVASARDQALSRYQAALGRIADADRRIADIRLQGEFQIADIRRGAQTDYAAYQSRQAELTKLNGRITDEVAKGNLDVAEALSARQLSLAQSLNQEVKEGEKVVVSKEQAASNAVAGTTKANENLISVLEKKKAIEQAAADQQKKLYETLTSTLERLNVTLAKLAGAEPIDIPLSVDEQKAQDGIANTLSSMKAVALGSKVSVPLALDTRDYVAKFDSEVLGKQGTQVRVGVFLEDSAYKIKVNEIKDQKIVATAAVEFSGADLDAAIARAKAIVEGDFPKMQLAFDNAATLANFTALTQDVQKSVAEGSFVVTAQFAADDAEVAAVVEKYKTTITKAPVAFDPNTVAADQARAQLARPIIVPVIYQPSGNIPQRAAGGSISVPGYAGGGTPTGLIRGPGTGTSDSILAAVSNKEFIVKAMSVRKYGVAAMNAINTGKVDPDRLASAVGGSGTGDEVALNLSFNSNPIGRLSGSRNSINNLVDALTELSHQTGG